MAQQEQDTAKSRPKRQHYVSRFYLEYFEDSDGLVWTYDTAGNDIWPASPENTAVQANFYSPKDESGEYLDNIEDWLAGVETTAAPLYARVIDGKVLADQERADFSVFLASLYARSPANIRASSEFQGYAMQFAFDAYLSDRDQYDRLVDRIDEAKGEATSKEERDRSFEFGRDKDGYTLEINQHAGLLGIKVTDRLAPILFKMNWDLIIVDEQHLITSDNPVVRVTPPEDYHPVYGDGGFYGKRTWVTIPLSPTRLLRLTWSDDPEGRILRGNKQHGRLFNRQRAYFSEKYLFASKNDSGIRALGQKHKETRPRIQMTGMDRMAEVKVKRSTGKD